jgi:hypothetical protein
MSIATRFEPRITTLKQPRKAKSRWAVITLITLVAFFARFYRLPDYPLGTFFDPAINGLDAIRLMQRGGPVFFFPTNGGREPAFIYLLIPFISLFGSTPFSLRVLPALLGVLNVVFLFGLLYELPSLGALPAELARQFKTHRLWLATLGGLVMAGSYWHIVVSRLGLRPLLVPFLAVPLFWSFLKGWYSGQKRWFALTGLLMGLGGYTYPASWLLPAILVLALLPEFVRGARRRSKALVATERRPAAPGQAPTAEVESGNNQRHGRSLAANVGLLILVAALTYAPMAWYLLKHPAQFSNRAFSVMVWNFLNTPGEVSAELARNVGRVVGYFCCLGSPTLIFGPPYFPGLSPLLAPFLLVGLVGAVRHGPSLFQRLVVLWWLIGLVPSVIAIEAPHPLRMIVALVPAAILIALSPIYLQHWLARSPFRNRFAKALNSPWLFWMPLLALLFSLANTFRVYFIDWTNLPDTKIVYDYEAIAIRDFILARAEDKVPIYLPLSQLNDPTLLFYLSSSFERSAVLSVPPEERVLIVAPEEAQDEITWVRLQNRRMTLLPPLTGRGQQLIRTALSASSLREVRTRQGDVSTVLRLAELAEDPVRFVEQPPLVPVVGLGPARLVGASFPFVIDSRDLPVTLFWQAREKTSREFEVLVRLVDDRRREWGNGDARPSGWVYPTTYWRPGLDEIGVRHVVRIGPTLPGPGRYWLAVSLFDPATGQRLPLTEGESPAVDTVFLGPLKVPRPPPPAASFDSFDHQAASFGGVARVSGYRLKASTIARGEQIQLTVLWEALARPALDYTVFVHLLDSDDNLVAGADQQPVGGTYPTTIWTPGERIIDSHSLSTMDAEGRPFKPGQYRLAVGLYDQTSGERLAVYHANGRPDPMRRMLLETTVTLR